MRNENHLKRCLETLKKNTNETRDTLYNGASLEVMIAMTLLNQKGNEDYKKQYIDWLDKGVETLSKREEATRDFINNS